jgi:hypothetical protein
MVDRNDFLGSRCLSRANKHMHIIVVTGITKRKKRIVGHQELPKLAAQPRRLKVHQVHR